MNHRYYPICRLNVCSGGQEQLQYIHASPIDSHYEGRPSLLYEIKKMITGRKEEQ